MANMAGIAKYINAPVSDHEFVKYIQSTFEASRQLHKLINEQEDIVFINCGAGVSRSSTVFLAFIALFGLYKVDFEEMEDGYFAPETILKKDPKDRAKLIEDLLQYLRCYHH